MILANILGFITAEWKGAGAQSIRWIIAGLIVMVGGVCMLAWGNSMIATGGA